MTDRSPKPDVLEVDADGIPPRLVDDGHWLVWQYEWLPDREQWTKVPHHGAAGHTINATDPTNGVDFDTALETYENGEYDGVGIILDADDLLVGLDWDDCRDPEQPHGSMPDAVHDAVGELETYTELSPSGTGFRQFASGVRPGTKTRADLPCDPVVDDEQPHLEMYDGTGGRYLTVTGQRTEGLPATVEARPQEIRTIYDWFIATDDQSVEASSTAPQSSVDLEDDTLLEKARSADNGQRFRELERGSDAHHGGDTSVADKAFCQHLAFWTGGDAERMDRLFRASGRMRAKWDDVHSADGDTYGEMTIAAALADQTEFFDPEHDIDRLSSLPDIDADGTETPSVDLFPRDGDERGYWKAVSDGDDATHIEISNFTIDVNGLLEHPDGTRRFDLTVVPRNEDPYDIQVEPTAFNDVRTFKQQVVIGFGTTFDGSTEDLNELRKYLNSRDAPYRIGTTEYGIHDGELVIGEGTLTADGWADDPTHVYVENGNPLENEWTISPSGGDEFDPEEVAEILKLIPETRVPERFIPVLGWAYAAPLRPIVDEDFGMGEFNHLNVTGKSGVGKSSTLEEIVWRAFGIGGEIKDAADTQFATMRAMSSGTLPVFLDEYKPSTTQDRYVEGLHRNLRRASRGATITKGKQDLWVEKFVLHTPVCVSGEQPIIEPAVCRRCIETGFSERAVNDPRMVEAFHQLVGGSVGTEADADTGDEDSKAAVYEGKDLSQHALAYYQWLLDQDIDELRELWMTAQQEVARLLEEYDCSPHGTIVQGFVTVLFGSRLYHRFARSVDLDPEETAMCESNVEAALRYLIESETEDGRKSHLDQLLDVFDRAITDGALEEDTHYTMVDPRDRDDPVVVFKNGSAIDKANQYAERHDIEEELLGGWSSYKDRVDEAVDDESSPVVEAGKMTSTINRGFAVDIDAFDSFRTPLATDADNSADGSEFAFEQLETSIGGTHNELFVAQVVGVDSAPDWKDGVGSLEDDTGVRVQYEIVDGAGLETTLVEGQNYRFEHVRVEGDASGRVGKIILDGGTEVTLASRDPSDARQASFDTVLSTDGGSDSQHDRLERIVSTVRSRDGVDPDRLPELLEREREGVEADVETLKRNDRLYVAPDGLLRLP